MNAEECKKKIRSGRPNESRENLKSSVLVFVKIRLPNICESQ